MGWDGKPLRFNHLDCTLSSLTLQLLEIKTGLGWGPGVGVGVVRQQGVW